MIKTGSGSLLKRLKPKVIRLFPVMVLASLWVAASCNIDAYNDGGGEKGGAYQTRILNVYAEPDTVTQGDTTRISCIIQDSTNKTFIFVWLFSYGHAVNVRDTTWRTGGNVIAYSSGHNNYIDWVAPNDTIGFFNFGVRVDNRSDSIPVESGVGVVVN